MWPSACSGVGKRWLAGTRPVNKGADATKLDPTPIACGISKIRPDEHAQRLADGLEAWRSCFAGRIFAFTEEAALSYGELMGDAARAGRPMSAPDGRIAAIARIHSAPLATLNVADFRETGVELVDPWRG